MLVSFGSLNFGRLTFLHKHSILQIILSDAANPSHFCIQACTAQVSNKSPMISSTNWLLPVVVDVVGLLISTSGVCPSSGFASYCLIAVSSLVRYSSICFSVRTVSVVACVSSLAIPGTQLFPSVVVVVVFVVVMFVSCIKFSISDGISVLLFWFVFVVAVVVVFDQEFVGCEVPVDPTMISFVIDPPFPFAICASKSATVEVPQALFCDPFLFQLILGYL